MSGFANIRAISDATDSGNYLFASFRKQATQTTGAGVWFDLSMSPGNPAPNYYIGSPNVFVPLKQSTDGGLRHGGNVSQFGKKKFLRKLMALTSVTTPISCKLLDYLGFYGFVDESVLDEQFMDNTQGLTRYSDGAGVQLMPVVVAGHTGGKPFTVKYTNQDGVSGRIAQTVTMGTQITNGTILHSQGAGTAYVNNGPFMPLQAGDAGIRSVQSVAISASYLSGVLNLVLCKPLMTLPITTLGVTAERDLVNQFMSMPKIYDGACLTWLMLAGANTPVASPLSGHLEFGWS